MLGAGNRIVSSARTHDRSPTRTFTAQPDLDHLARMPATYHLSHLRTLEAEAVQVMREVAAEFERPVLLFSGGKDSIVLLRLAEKAFRPGAVPVPGDARRHRPQLPRGDRVPRPAHPRNRRAADRRLRRGLDPRRARRRGDRAARLAQRPADGHAARRDHRARLRRGVRRRAARRGARAGQGARAVLPRPVRPVGAPAPAPGAVDAVQRAHRQGRARARLSDLQLDRARRVAVHRRGAAGGAVDLLRARPRGVRARRHALREQPVHAADGRRAAVLRAACATARSAT